MSTKAVIFDLDDTLISEIDYAMSGYAAVSEYIFKKGVLNKDVPEIKSELVRLFSDDHKNVFNRFLKSNGLFDDRDSVMELVDVYRSHFPDIKYYDDVRPALDLLKEQGIFTGILSDGYAVTQTQKIKALKAEEDFDIIVLTDELGREAWKPSPTGFEQIEKKLMIKPSEIIYVGDNPEKDFYLSVTAGIRTARIIRENGVYSDRDYLHGVREDYRIYSLTEVV